MNTPDTTEPQETPEDQAEAILAHLIHAKGGERRSGQVEAARHVARALSTGHPELLQGGTGIGKALDVDTPIPTQEGWVRMGDLEAGVHHPFDAITGKPCNITEAFDVMTRRDCYEVVFFGGGKLIADGKHLWNTVALSASTRQSGEDAWEGAETRTTEEIAGSLRTRNRPNHRIPLAPPVAMKKASLPIDPYELGFWLGRTERRSEDEALMRKGTRPARELKQFDLEEQKRETAIIPTDKTARSLKRLGLLTSDRGIPTKYMFASEQQRRDLLAGFLDSSGQVTRPQRSSVGQVIVYKTQVQLMEDLHALACSLGIRASVKDREFRDASYRQVYFTPDQQVFYAPEKQAALGDFEASGRRMVGHRSIVEVNKVPTRPVRCIAIDSESHLYLAGRDFIPTHNSLAYIAGALASGLTTAVCPHTKALQDQLGDDLDLVSEAFEGANFEDDAVPLDHAPTYAVVKGRSAYYCGNRVALPEGNEDQGVLDADGGDGEPSPSSALGKEIALLREWAKTTTTGDRADAPEVSSKAWQMVCGSSESCSANGCKDNPDLCFAQQARNRATDVDIVVINQAYLAAAMKIEFLDLHCDAVIVDEAHEFPKVVSGAFGATIKRKRVEQTLKRATNVLLVDELVEEDTVDKWTKDCTYQLDQLDAALGTMRPRGSDREIVETPAVAEPLQALIVLFDPIRRKVRAAEERAADEKVKAARHVLHQTVKNLCDDLRVVKAGSDDFQVSWADKDHGEKVLRSAQFDVSETIRDTLIGDITEGRLVMTSATLTVAGSFDYPAQQMGLTLDARYPWEGHVVSSPFDYTQQGMLWLPENMPAPGKKDEEKARYAEAVADVATGVARAAGGRTLVLCTSKDSVATVSQKMADALEPEGIRVLVQQSGEPTQRLAREFGGDPRTVLVGTRTFWTGVSVEGDTCVAVVVDKLPFPTPTDPIIAARTDKVEREEGGYKGFIKVSLSEAILTIVQGVGRLIRTVTDRGVVVLCDPRLNPRTEHVKSYWRNIANSLPPFTRTVDEARVHAFLHEINDTANDVEVSAEVDEAAGEQEDDTAAVVEELAVAV